MRVAVLIPCWNEEVAIGHVVRGFREALPGATVYVYDNNSADRTAARAAEAGAVVRAEPRQGKGNVVRRMFADVEADLYLLVDGDGTYDPKAAPRLVDRLLAERLDLVNAARVEDASAAYRRGHRLGNLVLTRLVAWLFGHGFADMLSGYKALSRRFVKSFPALATGFEIETELTVHALALGMPVAELPAPYRERPAGSASKLHTWADGARILRAIVKLVREERPLAFFSSLALGLAVLSLALGAPVIATYLEIGRVPRLPTAILAMGIMVLASLSLACGLVLDTVTRGRREMKRLAYLRQPAPGECDPAP